MARTKRVRRPVDQLQGIGNVYIEQAHVAEVAYDLTVTQEFIEVRRISPPQEIQGARAVKGMLSPVGAGVIPMLRSPMVLELEDSRRLDFYVARPVSDASQYRYEITGSGRLRDS